MSGLKLYRVKAVVKGMREPFIDWYRAESEAEALYWWQEDWERLVGTLVLDVSAREATEQEVRLVS